MTYVVDLGCGATKEPGAIGIDLSPRSNADVRADFRAHHLPLLDSSIDKVVLNHVVEHFDDVESLIREVHRICRPGAEVVIRVPHFSSIYAFTDFTHRHFFSSRSFDRLMRGADTYYDSHIFDPTLEFTLLERSVSFEAVFGWLAFGRWRGIPLHKVLGFEWLINHVILDAYEKRFAFWVPAAQLTFRLKVVKP